MLSSGNQLLKAVRKPSYARAVTFLSDLMCNNVVVASNGEIFSQVAYNNCICSSSSFKKDMVSVVGTSLVGQELALS